MAKAFIEVRSQGAKGTWPKQGPDTYVCVQVVPDGVERLRALNRSLAAKRGIRLFYCGEGYRNRCATERSALGKAMAEARRIVSEVDGGRLRVS